MVEVLTWIDEHFFSFIFILTVLAYFFYALVSIWRGE